MPEQVSQSIVLDSKPTRAPVFGSLVFPGVGQFMQGHWVRGLLYLVVALSCCVAVVAIGIVNYVRYLRLVLAIGENAGDPPPAPLDLLRVAIWILVPLGVALVLHAISILDAWLVFGRRLRAWTERQIEERVGRVLPSAVFVLAAALLLPGRAGAAEIHALVASNRVAAVDSLLEADPRQARAATADGVTPLHLAAALDLQPMAGVLVAYGGDVNARTAGGFTPLHWAASKNAWGTARLLLILGAKVDAQAGNGLTPLHWAAGKNATNTVQVLVAAGARLDLKTSDGYTPLEYAVLQDANDAAELLAFHLVTREWEERKATGPFPVPVAALPPDAEEEAAGPVAKPHPLPLPEPGQALRVGIGQDEELEFVWVESLKLWVGKYEITNGQFRRYNRKHSSLFRERYSLDGPRQPVVLVSWEDARAYAQWLNKSFGDRIPPDREFRLPTEAEWMAAARCGDRRTYPWGDDWPPKYGNFCDLTARKSLSEFRGLSHYDDGQVVTCAVEESGHNEWGIYGLAGNVWEWCEDWYDEARTYRVRHGGSWDFDPQPLLRIDARGFDRPDARSDTVGFRLVVAPRR